MMTRIFVAAAMAIALAVPATAQETIWRNLAMTVPLGSTVNVRLTDGRRFSAVLVEVRDAEVVLQPKTRQPLPVQSLPYAAIASLERAESGGLSAGKAIAIGAAAGAGVFLGLLVAMLSSLD
jgi:hypothetical protein